MKQKIIEGKTFLGIEFGSTRIKACLIDDNYMPIADGFYEWENKFEDGYWTYSIDEIHKGTKECFASLKKNISEKYGVDFTVSSAIGISGMMHGYLAFDKDDNLLVPFRTWRNTTTEQSAKELSELFGFNIPQRWSIAHLYQAILNGEEHTGKIAHITTLAGYIHYLLTGKWEIGIGEGSGIFPISGFDYDEAMLSKFDSLISKYNYGWNIRDILPKVKVCGDGGTTLTESGAEFIDCSGTFKAGIPVCPPEGDAGTGMVATNSVKPRTGNVSAGTSVFSMLVLDKPLRGMFHEIDVVTTPAGAPVAMIHSNNGCSELDLWVKIFGEFASLIGKDTAKSDLYNLLYNNAMNGDADCGGVISYNYLAAEPVTGAKIGKPMYYRTTSSTPNLATFFRSQLYASVAVLKAGMEILTKNENVTAENFNAHGGLFKVRGVSQQILADALNTPVSVSETAGEGGAWGMALLAAYLIDKGEKSLDEWLEEKVFSSMNKETLLPDPNGVKGFEAFYSEYKSGLEFFK